MPKFYLTLVLIWTISNSYGQTDVDAIADTLTSVERAELRQGLRNSSFGYHRIADSFSRKGDSINAGRWFLKIDPYYLMWEYSNPATPDTIMNRLALTEDTKIAYREIYSSVYTGKKSDSYIDFEKMHTEDQLIRNTLDKCGDTFTCSKLLKRMHLTDSMHFEYLYDYVKKNGWPTIANGSLHACIIAIHDHKRHEYYAPLLKKAIANGQAPMEPLGLILFWKEKGKVNTHFKEYLDTSRKFSYDISSILDYVLPSNLSEIKKIVKKYCPVKYYVVYESSDPKAFEKRTFSYGKQREVCLKLLNELRESCHTGKSPKEWYKDTGEIHYIPTDRKKERAMLYVVYQEKELRERGNN